MALSIKGITLTIGSKTFNVKGIDIRTIGPTLNNTPPLVTAPTPSAGSPVIHTNWKDK